MNRLSLAIAILCLAGGSTSAFAGQSKDRVGAVYAGHWDAQKARHQVGAVYRGTWDAQKARHHVGGRFINAVQTRHEVGATQASAGDKGLDLNEGF